MALISPCASSGNARVIQGWFAAGYPRILLPYQNVPLQPSSRGPVVQVPPALVQMWSRSMGQRLPEAVQRRMEDFFHTDFSDVRIHVGPQPASIGALAFTAGSNLYFAPGHYNPGSSHGRRLLGHELTHVVQQRLGRVRNPFGSGVAVVQDPLLEAEAERMGLRIAASAPIQPKMAGPAISLQVRLAPPPLPPARPVVTPVQISHGTVQPSFTGRGATEKKSKKNFKKKHERVLKKTSEDSKVHKPTHRFKEKSHRAHNVSKEERPKYENVVKEVVKKNSTSSNLNFTVRGEDDKNVKGLKFQHSYNCTGYNKLHRDDEERKILKGQYKTKAPALRLDTAVQAINNGQATYLGSNGRNVFVEYNGYYYGLHTQVFQGKRQLFPLNSKEEVEEELNK